MKSVSLFLVLSALTACSQSRITGLDLYQVKDQVKTIKQVSYIPIREGTTWKRNPLDTIQTYDLFLFDKDGNIIKEQHYSPSSKKLDDVTAYQYKNDVIDHIITMYDGKVIKTEYILKAKPNFEILQSYSDAKNDTTEYEWQNHRPIAMLSKKGGKTIIEYNKDGNCIKQVQYDMKGAEKETTVYEYLGFDQKGNWTRRIMYDKNSSAKDPFVEEREFIYFD